MTVLVIKLIEMHLPHSLECVCAVPRGGVPVLKDPKIEILFRVSHKVSGALASWISENESGFWKKLGSCLSMGGSLVLGSHVISSQITNFL